ncbi:MAG: ribonuclease HII [Puniceicoccales bacterium]|nr:ribonuclease HII [Puniceicoccales bacterium]
MNERIAFDQEIIANNSYLIGIDEAGRGPLAGPVVICGVKVSRDFLGQIDTFPFLSGVNDSKKLSSQRRETLFQQLLQLRKQQLLQFTVTMRDHKIIDQINILAATTCAMNQVVERFFSSQTKVLVDGKSVQHFLFPHMGIIKGDCKSFSIAAASIIAKVIRDRIMNYFSKKYPQYGFEKHKGYGTRGHIDAIKRHGLSPIHRATFCKHFINS